MNQTLYHTQEGQLVYRAQHPKAIVSANAALRKAKQLGLKSLIATEADGNVIKYTDLLLRNTNGAT